jgi:hypothetical protein
MITLGVPKEKLYTLDPISKIEKRSDKEKNNTKNNYFGWDGKLLIKKYQKISLFNLIIKLKNTYFSLFYFYFSFQY